MDITVEHECVDGRWCYVGRSKQYPDFTVYEDTEEAARYGMQCHILLSTADGGKE